jgi:hypothetical protein
MALPCCPSLGEDASSGKIRMGRDSIVDVLGGFELPKYL